MLKTLIFLLIPTLIVAYRYKSEGDTCVNLRSPQKGICRRIADCQAATNTNKRRHLKHCRVPRGTKDVLVCCTDPIVTTTTTTTTTSTSTTTTTTSTTTTTTPIPQLIDFDPRNWSPSTSNTCRVDPRAPKKTGRKARDKCIDYQNTYVSPCVRVPSMNRFQEYYWTRVDQCHHDVQPLIIGGTEVKPHEMPHMVLLGFGAKMETAQWSCGGSLISDNYILTAAHCTSTSIMGTRYLVQYAALNITRRSEVGSRIEDMYNIIKIVKHHDHNPTKHSYNDIALLKTDRTVTLSEWVVPACLPAAEYNDTQAQAAGWGVMRRDSRTEAQVLQQVMLTKSDFLECNQQYENTRKLTDGINAETQLCYGGENGESKDTCQGDSGGPLQVQSDVVCMYTVIGITSLGKSCGTKHGSGVYTRVEHYVPWIEGIVWPDD